MPIPYRAIGILTHPQMQIGAHVLRNDLFVAPMAGVTDRPFRTLARRFGAGLAVSEMVSSRPELRGVAQVAAAPTTRASPTRFRCRSPAPTRA